MKRIFNTQYLIFCLFLVSCSLFFVVPVFAAETKPATPEQNPMCWTREACKAQWTSQFGSVSDFEKGKYWESPGPGGICKEMGVCIPAGKTSLEIQLPTLKTTTADLGDYIKAIYVFLISIGGIVAAVLIIKGGFEWVTSGGSPERVKSAQSTIGSALMGLLLLLGSYTLLYTINPDLVRLRLPGVYMIRKIVMGTTWCKDLPAGTKLAYAGGYKNEIQVPPEAFKIDAQPVINDPSQIANLINQGKVPACPLNFFWKGSNDQTCQGHLCELDSKGHAKTCYKISGQEEYFCRSGNLSGRISGVEGIWEFPWVIGGKFALRLNSACHDGYYIEGLAAPDKSCESLLPEGCVEIEDNEANQEQVYKIFIGENTIKKAENDCNNHQGFKGFFLSIQANDNEYFGVDQQIIVGRDSQGQCIYPIANSSQASDPSCKELPGLVKELFTGGEAIKNCLKIAPSNVFLTSAELRSGSICDIVVTNVTFPN